MKNLQESWLEGETPATPPDNCMTGAIQLARCYFSDWREQEVRNLWHEIEFLIEDFIESTGRKSFLTNPITILSGCVMIFRESFKSFQAKWLPKFESITLAKTQIVTIPEVMLASFILKHAAENNIQAVLDACIPLINAHNDAYSRTANAPQLKKSVISEQNKKNAKASRKSNIRILIETILSKDVTIHFNSILNRLKNQTINDKEICLIETIVNGKNGYVAYHLNKNIRSNKTIKTITMRNFETTISKIRSNIKNKLP